MELLLGIIFVITLIIIANVIVRSGETSYRRTFDRLLIALSLPIFIIGVLFVLIPDEQWAQMATAAGEAAFPLVTNSLVLGLILQVIAAWGIVVSFHSTRQSMTRFMPIDPDSAVHTLALVCLGWLVGSTLVQVTQNSLEQLIESIGSLELSSVVLQESLFAFVGLMGVGLGIRRTPAQTRHRLGLGPITLRQTLIGLVWVVALVLFQALAGGVWYLIDPEQAEIVNELNLDLLIGLDTIWEWLGLALATGIGEEMLFRGALQPVIGIWVTSIVFALLHVQYGLFTPATLTLLVFALALGVIRQRHNTTLAIFVHAGYNFTLGLIALFVVGV